MWDKGKHRYNCTRIYLVWKKYTYIFLGQAQEYIEDFVSGMEYIGCNIWHCRAVSWEKKAVAVKVLQQLRSLTKCRNNLNGAIPPAWACTKTSRGGFVFQKQGISKSNPKFTQLLKCWWWWWTLKFENKKKPGAQDELWNLKIRRRWTLKFELWPFEN